MKDIRLLSRLLGPTLAKLRILAIAALLIFLCVGAKQAATGGSTPGLTTFDAPGAGTIANAQQGTAAFAIDTSGDIAGFETDTNGVHHGLLRAADGTFAEFDASGAGTGKNQATQALSIDSAGDIAGTYPGWRSRGGPLPSHSTIYSVSSH